MQARVCSLFLTCLICLFELLSPDDPGPPPDLLLLERCPLVVSCKNTWKRHHGKRRMKRAGTTRSRSRYRGFPTRLVILSI